MALVDGFFFRVSGFSWWFALLIDGGLFCFDGLWLYLMFDGFY
jgi:hypothetical protein